MFICHVITQVLIFVCEYNKVLSIISIYINTHNVVYCIIGGDMNTDIIRIKSTNTISLNYFIVNEDRNLVIKTCSWDAECDLAREQSLLWHYIWKQCDKPGGGYLYEVMVYTRSKYHYLQSKIK